MADYDIEALRSAFPREDEIPFDSGRQFMATLHSDRDTGEHHIYLKRNHQ